MNLPSRVFEIMPEIAEQNNVKPMKWARASGLNPSRISEFKRMTKKTKAGAAESDPEREVGAHLLVKKFPHVMGRAEKSSRRHDIEKRIDKTA